MSAAAELAELRERVDLLDAVMRSLGVPLDQPGGRLTGWAASQAGLAGRVDAIEKGLAAAYRAARWQMPEGLGRPQPRHLRLVRGEEDR